MLPRSSTQSPLLLGLAALLACSETPPPTCAEAAACPAGHECRASRCVALPAEDAGADAGPDAGSPGAGPDAGAADGGNDAGAGGGADAGPQDAGCGPADAGTPPNLLQNPGFECGDPPQDWVPSASGSLASETSGPHSGLRAARLTSDDGGVPVSLFALAPRQASGLQTWCASAWLRGVPAGRTARISLWMLSPGGGLVEHDFSTITAAGFEKVAVSAQTQVQDDRVLLRLWLASPASGDTLVIDDVEQWVSADGGCLSH